jgi:hypothetical protein
MPSTGHSPENTQAGARGDPGSGTDSGPPERTMPLGAKARISASSVSQDRISEYTPISRMRRAISCVYWEPKSRISRRLAWMSVMA